MCIYIYIVRSLPGSSSRAEVLGGAFGLLLMREAHQCQYVGQKPYWFNEQHAEEEKEKSMGVHYFCTYVTAISTAEAAMCVHTCIYIYISLYVYICIYTYE